DRGREGGAEEGPGRDPARSYRALRRARDRLGRHQGATQESRRARRGTGPHHLLAHGAAELVRAASTLPSASREGNVEALGSRDHVGHSNVLETTVSKLFACLIAATLIAITASLNGMAPAAAQTQTVLYRFCSQSNCADGDYPFTTQLTVDPSGAL